MKIASILLLLACTLLLAACNRTEAPPEPADLLLLNGRVETVDADLPEAESIAVRGDRILAVGTTAEMERFRAPATRVIDLGGRLVLPGFIESHGHFMGIGRARLALDLTEARSYEEIVRLVSSAVLSAEPGEWIDGRGWHQSKWETVPDRVVGRFQTHHDLSAVSPGNPVVLTHSSGHALLANADAMRRAGITAETEAPPGGEIIRDETGQPTGIFVETAQWLILEALEADRQASPPEVVDAERRRALALANEEVLSRGVTTFHDAGVDTETLSLFEAALDRAELDVRLYVMLIAPVETLPELLPQIRAVGLGDDRLTVRAIKMMFDGALGPRGAWLLEPYADLPDSTGMALVPPEQVRAVADLALEHGYQLCVHAIGDRANRELLDVYEAAFREHPEEARDARFRIEHAQVLAPEDVPRFAQLGVIASVQGIHASSDGPWTPDRLGPERSAQRAYQFRRLLDAGTLLVNGSDAPVEPVDPISSFHASITMRMPGGGVFNDGQQMTREEALRSYTLDAAWGGFEEELKGSITPGKLADLVVLSRDIMRVPEEEILGARVLYTVVGGAVVYEADPLE
jgi:predicted amidohydrolase YtcJ